MCETPHVDCGRTMFTMPSDSGKGDEKVKLYWRYKKDGAWTWKAACTNMIHIDGHVIDCRCGAEEEEE